MEALDGREAQEGLVDQGVAEEVLVVPQDQGEPGAHHGHEEQRAEQHGAARRALPRQRQRPAAGEPPEQRQREPDRSLGERRGAHRQARNGHEPPGPAVQARAHQAVERQRDEGRERHVEDHQSGEDQDEGRRRHDDRGEQRAGGAHQPARHGPGERDHRDGAERGRQARRELVDAQQLVAPRDEPVEHRRACRGRGSG